MNDTVDVGAFEHNGQQVARGQFYAIACDPSRSVVVEACAGAGKTWMLVSRILRALLDGADPQDILAITFTKKAAAEMRQRLLQWLREFDTAADVELTEALRVRGVATDLTPSRLEALRQLYGRVLRAGRPVQIRTFHSWFAALLRGAPLAVLDALQLPARYELLEDDEQAIALVWRRLYARLRGEDALRADYFASVASFGRNQTQQALLAALHKRSEFALADAHGVVDASVQPVEVLFPELSAYRVPELYLEEDSVRQLLWNAAAALGQCSGKKCQKAASALELALTNRDSPGIFNALFTQGGTLLKLSDKALDTGTLQIAQDLLVRVRSAMDQQLAWEHQQRMARLTRALLDEFAELKRLRGWIDMGDLERTAQVLMSDSQLSGWMQERLDSRVRHLLIDEFQDTNPLQWQTLSAWLDGYAGASVAPSVFIVGDPKQSIYRFRRAEPQVFEAAKRFVSEGLGGDLLCCDHTRRNARGIVRMVNAVMHEAQAAAAYEGFRTHTTESTIAGEVWSLPRILREGRSINESGATANAWRDSLTTPRHMEEDTLKTLEVRQAARWLAQQIQHSGGTLQPGDIMVLARKRERLGLMQSELVALGIPAQQPEKSDLGDLPEVQDIIALLDCLVSSSHDLSLARVLKSPLFGLHDSVMVDLVLCQRRMASSDGETSPWWTVIQTASDLSVELQSAAAILMRWQQWVRDLPPHDALSLIYDDGDVLARYAATAPVALREAMLANLRAVLHAALQFNGGRYATPYAFVRALRAGGNPAPVQAQSHAVRLLTIHGAKGLEATLVVLLDTDAEAPRSESMGVLVQWPGEDAYPKKFIFLASEANPPVCAVETLAQERQARDREELNALYVALTRTQTTLAISAVQPHRASASSWWQRLLPQTEPVTETYTGQGTDGEQAEQFQTAAPFLLKVLPREMNLATSRSGYADEAIKSRANTEPGESLESRIGQAMHRLLEWHTPQAPWTASQLNRLARDFALDPLHVETARIMALGILKGEGAWAWDASALRWQGNEVALSFQGQAMRVDRLVQLHSTSEWWVLDFKSSHDPMALETLRAQLARYRAAVQRIQPGERVRAAFLTPQGRLLELEPT